MQHSGSDSYPIGDGVDDRFALVAEPAKNRGCDCFFSVAHRAIEETPARCWRIVDAPLQCCFGKDDGGAMEMIGRADDLNPVPVMRVHDLLTVSDIVQSGQGRSFFENGL